VIRSLMSMPVQLLALDIDGTLLNPRGELTARNRAAIARAQSLGVEVLLVTGRRFASARILLRELALDLPLVSHNGALTKEVETLATLDFHPLDEEVAHQVVDLGREAAADMICCDDPHGLGTMVIEGVSSANRALQGYLARYWEAVVEVEDLRTYLDHPPIQMMFSGSCALMERLVQRLEETIGDRARVFQTRYRAADLTILDVLGATASKGMTLAAHAERLGIAREETLAIGDNHNDLSMLQYAGYGVLMGNADDDLKRIGGLYQTASNEEDGVALAIERFLP
jgi:Cof subfamily protein (haloacid dehalogenase superfamily)